MKTAKTPIIVIVGLIFLFVLISGTSNLVSAEPRFQNTCEEECACLGFTPEQVWKQYNERKLAPDSYFTYIYPSRCAEKYGDWTSTGPDSMENILRKAGYFLYDETAACDKCRNEQNPPGTPTSPGPENEDLDDDGFDDQFEDPDVDELAPCVPFKELGDLDCDGIPDEEDLCRATRGTQDHCGCGTIIAGDLLFRAGMASWITSGPVGDFDFGHVAMFTGDISVDSDYSNPHPDGMAVIRYDPEKELYTGQLANGPFFSDKDIVVDSIIEADGSKHLDGVYISNKYDLYDSHNSWLGATMDNVAFGRPPVMTCSQRAEVVQQMMYYALWWQPGDYKLFKGANCANYVLEAYRTVFGNHYLQSIDSNDYNYFWPISPNILSTQLDLYDLDGKNVYRAEDAKRNLKPIISIHSNNAGVNFRNQNTPSDHNISWRVNAPANQNSDKPLLTVYDGAGNTSGETSAGVVAEIPGSEVFAHDDLPTVVNVVGQDALLIQVNVESAADFELMIHAENYPSPGQTITILYPKTPLESNVEFQVELIPTALDPESLAMYVYRDGADNSEEVIVPTVETGEMEATSFETQPDEPYFFEEPTGSGWQESGAGKILWLVIPGILFFGVSLVVLVIGLFTKSKTLIIIGLILTILVVCAAAAAAVYFFWLA